MTSQEDLVMYTIVPALVVVINIIEIGILVRNRKNLKNYERLLLSLSVADLLVGITFLASVLVQFKRGSYTPISVGFWYSITTSLFHIVLLTLDRAIAVLYPLKHRIWITAKFTKISIGMSWIFSLLTVTSSLLNRNKLVTKTVIGYMTDLAIFMLVIAYSIIIYKVLIKRYRHGPLNRSNSLVTRRDLNLVVVSIFITATFAGFTLPFSIKTVTHNKENFVDMLVIVLNSLTNPIIYFFWMFLQRRARLNAINQSATEGGGKLDSRRT